MVAVFGGLSDKHKTHTERFAKTDCCVIFEGRESKCHGQETSGHWLRIQMRWYLIGVIGSGPGAFHTMGGHNCPQVVTFY